LNPHREGILLDDHPLWLETLANLCQEVGIDVVGSCTTSQEALDLLGQRTVDILITDLRLGRAETALGCIREARKRVPGLRVLVISGFDDPASVDEALTAGANAFISKSAAGDDLAAAVRQVFNQSLFIGPSLRESSSYAGNGNGTYEAGDGDSRPRRAGLLERPGCQDPVDHRADSEIPLVEHLPQARSRQPHRSDAVGYGACE
jgi:DNA-binding NarL/FixJ family response regulator